jgi:hypothetical protein
MLVTELDSGLFLVQGYPSGSTAYVRAEDAGPLREALAAGWGLELRPDSAFVRIAAPPVVRPRVGLVDDEETRPLQVVASWG